MGKSRRSDAQGLKKGVWTEEEDRILLAHVKKHGEGGWRLLPQKAGLLRCGKSCRLRWANYLRPGIRRGEFSHEEEETIIRLHASLGNRWATIARHLYRRTDNEVKNYWNTRLKKRVVDLDTAVDDSSADENPFDTTNAMSDGVSFGTGEDHRDANASPHGGKTSTFGSDDLLGEAIGSVSSDSLSPNNNGSTNFDLVSPHSLEGSGTFSSRARSGNFTTNTLNKIASKMSKFNLQIRPPFDSTSPVVESPSTSNNAEVNYASVFKETTSSEVFQGQFTEFQSPMEEFLLQSEVACNVEGFYDIFDAELLF